MRQAYDYWQDQPGSTSYETHAPANPRSPSRAPKSKPVRSDHVRKGTRVRLTEGVIKQRSPIAQRSRASESAGNNQSATNGTSVTSAAHGQSRTLSAAQPHKKANAEPTGITYKTGYATTGVEPHKHRQVPPNRSTGGGRLKRQGLRRLVAPGARSPPRQTSRRHLMRRHEPFHAVTAHPPAAARPFRP